jgi:hypothetical protein
MVFLYTKEWRGKICGKALETLTETLNNVQSYEWSWHTTEPSDYRIVVRYAMPKDQFDFMMDKR